MIDKEKINPQILKEWTAAKLPKNKYFVGDINSYLSSLEVATKSNLEARKILILAIRATKSEGGHTSAYVKNKIENWVANNLKTAAEVGQYVEDSQKIQSKGRYGQPIKQESKILAPTSDEIQQQNERWAKELGYESVEAMAKGTHDILINLRKTRAERLANKPKTGLTANGNQVVKRF